MVYQLWPDPEAALLAGILLGVESGIPEPVREAFNDTGTSHVIVISGFNITIVAGLFASLFGRWLGRFRGALAAAVGIALYTLLVGATPAVVRAAIMGGLGLFGYQIGRRQSGLHALSLSAAVMGIQNPQILWDVSFQLSFFATLGLVLFSEPMTQVFNKVAARFLAEEQVERLTGPVSEYFLFTFAAQITTLPLIAYHFGRISLVSFAANPLILPVQPPIMVLGGLAVGLGLIWNPLGKLFAPLVWPFALFTIRVVEFFAGWQSGVLSLGRISFGWVVAVYILIFASTILYSRYPEMLSILKPLPLALALGAAAVIVWRIGFTAPDGLLHLTLLDVGTGDALLIQTPNGRYTMINGGPSSSLLSDGLGRRLPPFQRELDVLVVASPREAQIAALPEVLERYPPAQALWAGPPSPSRDSDRLRETLTELDVPITLAQPGQRLDLGEGAELTILTSGERGAILSLEWGKFKAILPLGASLNDLDSLEMGQAVGEVEALLLADNGYAPLNPTEWIANLHPRVVLLSVAADDRDGLPDRETLEAVSGYTLLRTDQNGWIHISTNGEEMWVEAQRGQ
jgi:competence protein ComEC